MIIKFTFYILFTSFIFSAVKPEHNSTINYIHVLFEWDELSDIDMYNLKVSLDGLIVLDINTNNFFYIDENNIDWNNTYSWQACDSSNLSNCSDNYTFSTGSEIDLGELNLTIANSEKYSDGVTVFGHIDDPFSAAIDKDGNQIWNSGGLNTFCYFNYDQK